MYKANDENGIEISINTAKSQILVARAANKEDPKFYCPCPTCKKPLFPKIYGKKRKPHFSHYQNTYCTDNWRYEQMSDWHKNWQNWFALQNQEVYMISNDGEAHRADVCAKNLFTKENTVIEFQHSHISNCEFNKRNRFYSACKDRVIWIFDMTDSVTLNDDGTYSWNKRNRFEATFSNFNNFQNKITVFFEAKKLINGKEYIILAEITNFNQKTYYKFKNPNLNISFLNFLSSFISLKNETLPKKEAELSYFLLNDYFSNNPLPLHPFYILFELDNPPPNPPRHYSENPFKSINTYRGPREWYIKPNAQYKKSKPRKTITRKKR